MKRLVTTDRTLYDATGKWLGKEVIEVDCFTEAELKEKGSACPECGTFGGAHREYFVRTGQHGGGEVYGHYKQCSRGINV